MTYDNTETFDRYVKGILASATFPAVFPVVNDLDEGHYYYDGGVARATDIATAINKCKAKVGGDESKITVDVILCSGATFKDADASKYKSIRMGLRYLEIRNFYSSMDELIRAQYAYTGVEFRHVVAPTKKLETGIIPFHFDPKEIEHNINTGIQDAKAVIAMGSGKTMEYLIEYTNLKGDGKYTDDYGKFLLEKNGF